MTLFFAERGTESQAKEYRKPLEAGKHKEMDFLPESPESNTAWTHLYVGSLRPILDL